MAEPLTAKDIPDAVVAADMPEPAKTTKSLANNFFTGNRGNSGTNNLLQCDAKADPSVSLQSKEGNTYIEAGKKVQILSTTHIEKTDSKKVFITNDFLQGTGTTYAVTVGGDTTFNANANYNLNVIGTHKQHVKDQVIEASTQKVTVGGDQTIVVCGKQDIHVKSRNEVIDEDSKTECLANQQYSFSGDLVNTIFGENSGIKASTDRNITISDKEQISIAMEISLNIGASEKINIGAHIEQNLAKKHSFTLAHDTSITMGIKKEKGVLAKNIAGLSQAYGTKLRDDKASMSKAKYALSVVKAKLAVYG